MTNSNKRFELNETLTDSYLPAIEINPKEIIDLFRQKKVWLIGITVAVMIIAATILLFTPNRYTSHASILPSGNSSDLGGLMGLASNFGLGGSGGLSDENSSALYPSILNSNLVRDGVLEQSYAVTTANGQHDINLSDYFGQTDPNELRAALTRQTTIDTDKKLGVVRLRVETTSPQLSQQVLEQYLTQLEDYLKNKRRSQASDNESYLSKQLAHRQAELTTAEDHLKQFMQVNRNWASSTDPELNMALGRLKREVQVANETCLLLTQQLELARLEAQKDIPIVRLLDEPSLPTTKSGPARTVTTIFSGMAALLLVSIWILLSGFWKQFMGQTTESTPDKSESNSPRSLGWLKLRRTPEEQKTTVG